jgi:hypothetical protein
LLNLDFPSLLISSVLANVAHVEAILPTNPAAIAGPRRAALERVQIDVAI